MLNIIVPLAGPTSLESRDIIFPKSLFEINGIPLIELVFNNLNMINGDKNFIFILKKEDCDKYHLDNSIKILVPNAKCVILGAETKGSVCSCLMALDDMILNNPLIISNGDQIFDIDLNTVLDFFIQNKAASGVITFDSIHPKWSYVRLDEHGFVVETAEKNPLSRNAIAGFYYFESAKLFVDVAFKSILNDANVNGMYYVAPTINEVIIENKKVLNYKISNDKYHSFYSMAKIAEYTNLRNENK